MFAANVRRYRSCTWPPTCSHVSPRRRAPRKTTASTHATSWARRCGQAPAGHQGAVTASMLTPANQQRPASLFWHSLYPRGVSLRPPAASPPLLLSDLRSVGAALAATHHEDFHHPPLPGWVSVSSPGGRGRLRREHTGVTSARCQRRARSRRPFTDYTADLHCGAAAGGQRGPERAALPCPPRAGCWPSPALPTPAPAPLGLPRPPTTWRPTPPPSTVSARRAARPEGRPPGGGPWVRPAMRAQQRQQCTATRRPRCPRPHAQLPLAPAALPARCSRRPPGC
jgi:hypothetical protein